MSEVKFLVPMSKDADKITDAISKLMQLDSKFAERINDLLLLAQNAPNQYELGALSLSAKTRKYKK